MRRTITNILNTFITYLGLLCFYNFNEEVNYSFMLIIMIVLVGYFFKTSDLNFSKKTKKYATILSIVLGTVLVFGKMTYDVIEINNATFITISSILYAILKISLLYPLLKRLLCLFYEYIPKINILTKNNKINKKYFIFFFLIIFICYIPYLIHYYPGKITYDTNLQLSFIKNGILSDVHSLVHTNFLGLFVNIGLNIFHNENLGIMFYTLFQMLFLAFTYAFVCYYLYKKNVNFKIILVILFSYAILPIYTHYAVTVWKDILFATSFVYIVIFLNELRTNKTILNYLGLIFGLFLLFFMRSNGMYIFLVMLPFLIYYWQKDLKSLIIVGSIFLMFLFIKYPVYNYFKVSSSSISESLAIPTEQMARVITKNGNMSLKEEEFLNSITDISNIPNIYLTYIVDPVKNIFNNIILKEKLGDYFKVWGSLLFKNLGTYIEAYLSITLGYWYPGVNYWSTIALANPNIIDITASHKLPLAGIIWNIGLVSLITLLSFTLSLYLKRKNYLLYVPFLGLWLTMMIASPVYAEFRYVYGLFTSLPIILLLPFLKIEK